jgi:hypothetical protein
MPAICAAFSIPLLKTHEKGNENAFRTYSMPGSTLGIIFVILPFEGSQFSELAVSSPIFFRKGNRGFEAKGPFPHCSAINE